MTHDEMIREKAWAMYCEETKDSPAAVDFPNQVPRAYWEELLIRAAIRVIAPAVLDEAMDAVVGYVHPDYERLPGTPFATTAIRALKTRYEQ